MKYKSLLLAISLTPMALVQAESIDVDWLYMSPAGTWLERNEVLTDTNAALALPIDNLIPELFWWQSSDPQTKVMWQSPYTQGWPKQGDVVSSELLTGDWVIEKVQQQHLVLAQESQRRFWPMAQMHLLQWTQSQSDSGFELRVEQPSEQESKFQYAWQDGSISANVSYRLSLSDHPILHQTLIVSNNSQYDLIANGYSFAPSQQRPFTVMQEMVSRSQSDIATPKASQSEGIPTLISRNSVHLSSQANLWLPVSSTVLSNVERQYSLTWDTRMQGIQQARSSIIISSKDALPDIPGAITLGVFDQQIATLNSQYQPSSDHQATLDLGQSALVTVESKLLRENQWSLVVTNRSDENVKLELLISHWNGKVSEQTAMPIAVNADEQSTVTLELTQDGKMSLDK